MSTRERPVDRGARLALADIRRVGAELRLARTSAGLSLEAVSKAVGISASHIARIERGLVETAGIWQMARIGSIVGLDVRVRAYPGSDPLRDAGQVRLLGRLRASIHQRLSMKLEVPLPGEGDARAWDAWIADFVQAPAGQGGLPVEGESRITDAQAQLRRIMLKVRDAGVEDVLVVIADTPANRRAIFAARAIIADSFPISARRALAALAAGRYPGGSALVFI
jgi:transcriptional regulator with XRE-family HTH domain